MMLKPRHRQSFEIDLIKYFLIGNNSIRQEFPSSIETEKVPPKIGLDDRVKTEILADFDKSVHVETTIRIL